MNKDKEISIELNDVKFVIAYFPYRKKICLGMKEENVLSKIATFNNEYSAALFIEAMQKMIGLDDEFVPNDVKKTIEEMKGKQNV